MWQIELGQVTAICEALELKRRELEAELAPGGFYQLRVRAPELYITYRRKAAPGPYSLAKPCPWPHRDLATLKKVLRTAASAKASLAKAVYLRTFCAARAKGGQMVYPIGRIDLRLARA